MKSGLARDADFLKGNDSVLRWALSCRGSWEERGVRYQGVVLYSGEYPILCATPGCLPPFILSVALGSRCLPQGSGGWQTGGPPQGALGMHFA